MKLHLSQLSRWFALVIIITGTIIVFYFDLYNYFSFAMLKEYHAIWLEKVNQHYFSSVLVYISIYIFVVALSIPGATFLTLTGGFLFGPLAILYVISGATIGAMIVFFAVRTALGEWLEKKVSGWIKKMEVGFQRNAFSYLLILRLIPIFPFWAINIAAGLLNVSPLPFVLSTFIGIIPGAFVYVMLGSGLESIFKNNQTPDLNSIYTPAILLPLLALAFLALLPIIYKWRKGKYHA